MRSIDNARPIHFLDETSARLSAEVAEWLRPVEEQIERLDGTPGAGRATAEVQCIAAVRHNDPEGAMAVEQLDLESRPPLTVEEFEALAEGQGWDEDTPVELLDGELVWMSPTNDPHIGCVNRLNRLFNRRYDESIVLVSIQNPVRASEYDEPEPDVALLRPRADDYGTAKASADDILLLVEVSDKTLRTDLGRKARIYASAGVPEYWVVDPNAQMVYVHRTPLDGAYRVRTVGMRGGEVSAQFAPAVSFTIDEMLG